jgi:hypothetical protein
MKKLYIVPDLVLYLNVTFVLKCFEISRNCFSTHLLTMNEKNASLFLLGLIFRESVFFFSNVKFYFIFKHSFEGAIALQCQNTIFKSQNGCFFLSFPKGNYLKFRDTSLKNKLKNKKISLI